MVKRIIIFAILSGMIGFLQFCKCEYERFFAINGINAEAYKNNISGCDSLNQDDMGVLQIAINFDPQFYSHNYNSNFGFINSAMATSPCPSDGDEGCKDLIEKINVFCSSNFDSIHSANDTINSLFRMQSLGCYYNYDTSIVNLTQVIDYKIYTYNDNLVLLLDECPEIDNVHEFTIEIHLSNNEIFTAKTEEIIFEF